MNCPDILRTADSIFASILSRLSRRNRKFMLGHAMSSARSSTLYQAIVQFESLGAVVRLEISKEVRKRFDTPSTPPNFKLMLFDTSALRVLTGLPVRALVVEIRVDRYTMNDFAENLVMLELLRSGVEEIFCWKSGNRAEVAFIFRTANNIVPVQVNAGRMTFAHSVAEFLKCHPCKYALFMSLLPPNSDASPTRVPMYVTCICLDLAGKHPSQDSD